MARDYTKYTVKDLGENLNKRQLVFGIVKDYIEKNKPSYDDLTSVFKDEIQGSKGFIRKSADIKDTKRFNIKVPLKIKFGVEVFVSNQWGNENILNFIKLAESLGYNIEKNVESTPPNTGNDIKSVNSSDEHEYIKSVRVIIRNMENSEEIKDCSYFDLWVSSLNIEFLRPITTEYLSNISNTIFNDSKHVNDIKRITSEYSLTFDWVPQLWISKINDVDISMALKYFFDDDDSVTEDLDKIFMLDEYDLDNFFESDGVHSLEGLGEF